MPRRTRASVSLRAPESAHQQWGESPYRTEHWLSVVEGNCIVEGRSGRQPETNCQSINKTRAVHLLPGTTFSNVAEKGAYSSEKTSALTLVELERWLTLQVGGVYHQSVHASLLKPPVAAWEDGLARRRKALRKPEDP